MESFKKILPKDAFVGDVFRVNDSEIAICLQTGKKGDLVLFGKMCYISYVLSIATEATTFEEACNFIEKHKNGIGLLPKLS